MNMKSKVVLSVAFSAVLLASGCSRNNENTYQLSDRPVNGALAHVDAKIIATVIVLNKNEIAAARDAQQRASSPAVKNYAASMIRAHSKSLQEARSLSQKLGVRPEEGNAAILLHNRGQHELAALNGLQGRAFDKAYIDAVVRDHQTALNLIDQKLLPQAHNPALRRHLEITRAHVLRQLQQARVVQREISRP
jgi:putative membrane protein